MVVAEVGKRKGSVVMSLFVLANGVWDGRIGGGVVIRDSFIANLL